MIKSDIINMVFIAFSIISFFEPEGFEKIPLIDDLYFAIRVISILTVIMLIIINIKNRQKRINEITIIAIYFFTFIISMMYNNNFTINKIWSVILFLGSCIYFKMRLLKYTRMVIKTTYIILMCLCFFNIISVLLNYNFAKDYTSQIFYLLGIRTSFTFYSIFLIYISMIYSYITRGSVFSLKSFLGIFIAIIQLFLEWVATGITCTLIFFIVYSIFKKINKINISVGVEREKKKDKKINAFIMTIIGLFLNYGIVVWRIQDVFKNFIVNVLHKNVTLTDRVFIWDVALEKINKSLVWGYGNLFEQIEWYDRIMFTHNQFLQVTIAGGIIGLICFIVLFIYTSINIDKSKDIIMKSLGIAMLFTVFIFMITEIAYYRYFFWFTIIILCNLNIIEREKNISEEKSNRNNISTFYWRS